MKKAAALLAAVLVFALLSACKKKPDILSFSFESNPTTGYNWAYTVDRGDILVNTLDEYTAGGTAMGAGGTQAYAFEAGQDGTATLTFTYARPWEKVFPLRTLVYTYTVAEGKATLDSHRETIALSLPANSGSTGYTWRFTPSVDGVVTQTDQQYIAPAAENVGGLGTQVFALTAGNDGTVTLHFTYGPAWEEKDTGIWADYTFTVTDGALTQDNAEMNLGVLG